MLVPLPLKGGGAPRRDEAPGDEHEREGLVGTPFRVDGAMHESQFIDREVLKSTCQQIADLLGRKPGSPGDFSATEVGYGNQPGHDAHEACTFFQVPDVEVRASRRRFVALRAGGMACRTHGAPLGDFDPYIMGAFGHFCQCRFADALVAAGRGGLEEKRGPAGPRGEA